MEKLGFKKILCTALILLFTAQTTFAMPNYTVSTTTSESYSASSPVGTFSNYSSNGMQPAYTTNYNYGYYQPITTTTPQTYYNNQVYNSGVSYGVSPDYNQNYSSQTIDTPQNYNKVVTTTQQYVDTREKADKVIDRGIKVAGALAVVGAVTGFLIKCF